jgi:hypothetical protein
MQISCNTHYHLIIVTFFHWKNLALFFSKTRIFGQKKKKFFWQTYGKARLEKKTGAKQSG